MDTRPPNLLLLPLLTIILLFSQSARGQSLYIIDAVGLTIFPASTVQSGTPVTMQCQVTVSHDSTARLTHTFQIVRDDVPIRSFTTTEDTVVHELQPARAADTGSYECRVTINQDKSKTSFSQKLDVTGLQDPVLYLNKALLYEGDDFIATCSAPDEKGSLIFRFFRRFGNEEPQKMKQVAPTGNSSVETTLVLRQVGDYFLYCDYEINLVSGTRRSNQSNEVQVMVRALHINPVMNVLPSSHVYEGDVIEVVCKVVTTLKNIKVFLTKDKRILKQANVSLSHRFTPLEGDSGELVCKAVWGNVQKETYEKLTVKELFSKPRLTVDPVDIFEGDRFKLTCSVSVYVPERIINETAFSVYRNNIKMTSSETYITMAHPDKNGNYTCKAAASSSSYNFVKESPTQVVEAKVPVSKPVMSVVGGTLILGKQFQLLCHSDKGTLPLTYMLHGPRGLIGQREVRKPEDQAVFNCSSILKSSDLNKFMCHARNSLHKPPMVGSVPQLLRSTKIIEPVSKPVLTIEPGMRDVSEGQDLTLSCSVQSGTPPFNFTWYRADSPGALDTQFSTTQKAYYHVGNVKGEHKGGYYCVSNNPANESKQSHTLMITVKMAGWKKGLIAFFCILLILVLILVVVFRTCLRQFKRNRTGELSVKSASTKVERLSLTQAEVIDAANVTPGMMGKSVWSEHVSVSESDDQKSETATTELQYTGEGQNTAPVKTETDAVNIEVRNSKHGDPEQIQTVEYAELNHDTDHQGDRGEHHVEHGDHHSEHGDRGEHGEHGEHGGDSVQNDHADETVDETGDSNAADHAE